MKEAERPTWKWEEKEPDSENWDNGKIKWRKNKLINCKKPKCAGGNQVG